MPYFTLLVRSGTGEWASRRQHRDYCGVDLYTPSMYVCILDAEGTVLASKNVAARRDAERDADKR